jgi:hypothetical protein
MRQIIFIFYLVIKTPGKISNKLRWLYVLLKVEIFKINKLTIGNLSLEANNFNSFRVLYKEVFIEEEYKFKS